jgi:hypothetical protein
MQKANCRYGPGASYLYKTGMLANASIEAVGRTIDGGWASIQLKGTHNLCWINAKLIQTAGDIMIPDSYRTAPCRRRMTMGRRPLRVSPAAELCDATVTGGAADYAMGATLKRSTCGGVDVPEQRSSLLPSKPTKPAAFDVDDSCRRSSRNVVGRSRPGSRV